MTHARRLVASLLGRRSRPAAADDAELSSWAESEPFVAVRAAIEAGRDREAARRLAGMHVRRRTDPRVWQLVAESGSPDQVVPVAIRLHREWGRSRLAAGILTRTRVDQAAERLRRRGATVLFMTGHPRAAAEVFETLVDGTDDAAALSSETSDATRLAVARLNMRINEHVAGLDAPTGDDVRGFVLAYNLFKPQTAAVMAPMAGPLLRTGHAVGAVGAGTLTTPDSGVPEFERLKGCLNLDYSWARRAPAAREREWHVDWPAGVVECDGINYYSYFHERLGQKARAHRVDIADSEGAAHLERLMERAGMALDVCESLVPLAAHGKPIRIVLMEPHMAPEGVIREWCTQVGREHGIHTVAMSVGYENYYNNLGSLLATTLAVEDLTAQPELRMPFLGGEHRRRVAVAQDPTLDADPDEQVLSWICQDRSRVDVSSQHREAVVRRVQEVHAAGGKVFVALGKVSIDFAAPGDRGFAHPDFVTWMNHLVEGVAGSDNLLLVKPHPHELREEIVRDGVEMLRDLVRPDLPDNVVFLEHHAFNTHELTDLVDAAFLWNGTALLEFSILGVPVYPASIWAVRDYPVGPEILRTREEYDDVLQGRREPAQAEGTARRSATLLRLMRTDQVAIPFPYVRRPAVNSVTGPPALDVARLEALARQPDPHLERAASRFFEFA